MISDAARHLIESSFEAAYDEAPFRNLIQNLLVDADMKHRGPRSGQMVYESFREHVASYKRIAKYTDPDGEEMDVLAVKLRSAQKLERARTMQRNFAAAYLTDPNRPGRDAALIAYYADDAPQWRFSFVQMQYRTVLKEDGTIGTEKETTPVRLSFRVGKGEPSHTAKQQFVSLVQAEASPRIDTVKEAFDVDVVTEQFYKAYRDHYETLTTHIRKALDTRNVTPDASVFENRDDAAQALAKKLLGQLVFLTFLQKKGWLGVPSEGAWGDGSPTFLRDLYNEAFATYDNFYRDLLEPLFYDGLANDRGSGNYFGRLQCRIPFLNGGLFTPLDGFERHDLHFALPNEAFAAILDTFDRYNFTVREDEPLDKEVAVDPEMLGKVFEKLLGAEQQKKKGAFYTPRDIVGYMCRESLADHLDHELNTRDMHLKAPEPQQANAFGVPTSQQGVLTGSERTDTIPKADLEALLRKGSTWRENDRRVRDEGRETKTYSWQAPASIRENAAAIDAVLADVRVCDPAVGSGAFPVGMMQAIVDARRALTTYLDADADPARSPYALKRHAIRYSLYGVDLDASAIEIAQLRMWLSLVVDEEDFTQIKPLPNLRYKIVQGDALKNKPGGKGRHFFNNEAEQRLAECKDAYVSESHSTAKERLQAEIDALLDEMLDDSGFDFQIYFGEIWDAQDGFDVVIGNPPYVRQETLTAAQKKRYKGAFASYHGSADLFVYFIERGMGLLRDGGVFAYIVSNKWMRAGYGKNLREWLANRHLTELIDFGDRPVFQGVTAYPCILRMQKTAPAEGFDAVEVDSLDYDALSAYVEQNRYEVLRRSLHNKGWALVNRETQALLDRLADAGTPLGEYLKERNTGIYYGIKTGLNKAFVIDRATRYDLIDAAPNSADLIQPFLKGRDVNRYEPPEPRRYVIVIPSGWTNANAGDADDKWAWFADRYPALANHLAPYEDRARARYDQGEYWWELRSCSYYEEFERPKMIYQTFQTGPAFTLDRNESCMTNSLWMIPGENLPLLALLNSSMGWFLISTVCTEIQRGFQLIAKYFERIPIPDLTEAQEAELASWAERQLALHAKQSAAPDEATREALQSEIDAVDARIDERVYDLYGLSAAEIAIVEGAVG